METHSSSKKKNKHKTKSSEEKKHRDSSTKKTELELNNKSDNKDDFQFNSIISDKKIFKRTIDNNLNDTNDNNSENENLNKDNDNDNKETVNTIEELVDSGVAMQASNLYATESTFDSIGVCPELCSKLKDMGYKYPTMIQKETISYALKNHDLIGIAETGSGKTAAFAIPIIQRLLGESKFDKSFYALIIAPTRELSLQISEQFKTLGEDIGLKITTLIGGLDSFSQAMSLSKKPHIVIGTPGQVVYHLTNTSNFSLKNKLKFLVFDEADKLFNLDFEKQIGQILHSIPEERTTFLFSATLNSKVEKLKQASLKNPVKIQVNTSFTTVKTLIQNYLFIPEKYKNCYLVYLLNEYTSGSSIVFVSTCLGSIQITLMLRHLGFKAISINGKMNQSNRIGALNKFKNGERNILVATDVASRGLDIPNVDLVVNFDMPQQGEDYIHRVGRTARAGKAGRSITFVTQYDIEQIQKIETHIKQKLEKYEPEEKRVLLFLEKTLEASRYAKQEIKEISKKLKTKDLFDTNPDGDDDEGAEDGNIEGIKKKVKSQFKMNHSFVKKKRKNN